MTTTRQKVIDIFATFPEGYGDNNSSNPVTQEDIDLAQAKCGVVFPEDLKDFWLNCGWGFFGYSRDNVRSDNVNCFMSPERVSFVLTRNAEEGFEEVEIDDGMIPFFNLYEEFFYGMKEQSSSDRRIYDDIIFNNPDSLYIVSNDIWDFVLKLWDDPDAPIKEKLASHGLKYQAGK